MARRLFLERRTYRQARLQDAARLLPVLGLVLFFGPSFIRGEASASDGLLSGWLIYYFIVWLGLIVVASFLSRALMRTERIDTTAADPDPDPGREGGR